jgi:imidazolonepropionase-like amidohydrolase
LARYNLSRSCIQGENILAYSDSGRRKSAFSKPMHSPSGFAFLFACLLLTANVAFAQQPSKPLAAYIKEDSSVLVLDHVRVVDGTGGIAQEDMRIDIEGGKITRVESSKLNNIYPANAKVLDLKGKTLIPGIVGMHEHLFYPLPGSVGDSLPLYGEMADSAPRLYLAGGVTSARTAGSLEPYTDISLKKMIDAGQTPGPKLHITSPYLGGYNGLIPQLHTLTDPEDASRMVDYWASEGATSFKAYMDITPEELKAAVEHAHAKGFKITGHLCSVGFKEASAIGIDNLEHGLVADTEFYPGKKEGICPSTRAVYEDMAKNLDVAGAQVQGMIQDLVSHHVAITSTLAVLETLAPNRPPLERETSALKALSVAAREDYFRERSAIAADPAGANSTHAVLLQKEMKFEREFVEAGGLLMAGCDPTGYGGVAPGFADQRNIELLVEAGFTPVEAIHIATQNGAVFLGEDAAIGTISVGKAADLVLLNGNPTEKIEDIEKVETVFKDGVGFDPTKLIDSVRGLVGIR